MSDRMGIPVALDFFFFFFFFFFFVAIKERRPCVGEYTNNKVTAFPLIITWGKITGPILFFSVEKNNFYLPTRPDQFFFSMLVKAQLLFYALRKGSKFMFLPVNVYKIA